MNTIIEGINIIYNFLDKSETINSFSDTIFDKFTINNKELTRTGCFEGKKRRH